MFGGASPNLATLLLPTVKEMNLWGLAGSQVPKGFLSLWPCSEEMVSGSVFVGCGSFLS